MALLVVAGGGFVYSSLRGASPSAGRSPTTSTKSEGPRRGGEGPEIARERITFDDNAAAAQLYGQGNTNLKLLERQLGLSLHARGNELTVIGPPDTVSLARSLLQQLYSLAQKGQPLSVEEVLRGLAVLRADQSVPVKDVFQDTVIVSARARPIAPKGLAQKRYIDAIRRDDIVFGIGPAGTGKTYLAMAMAVKALMDKEVRRIVLTRPAVEAGEKLGFLPGTMVEKVNPYLRPLYDALNDMLDMEKAQALIERGAIEVAPLAFMRGRTLNDSFVILDEAQNTTSEQMKMFLTRLGYDSKAVITGDVTQVDLPPRTASGLLEAQRLLAGIPGIELCYFTDVDVVRHPLVAAIIKAYDRESLRRKEEREARRAARAEEERPREDGRGGEPG